MLNAFVVDCKTSLLLLPVKKENCGLFLYKMSLTYADFLYYFGERENYNSMNPIPAQLSYSSSFSSSLPKEFQVLEETQVPLLQVNNTVFMLS